jgi:flagellar hook-length control protein FliK
LGSHFADALALQCGHMSMLSEYIALHRSGHSASMPAPETASTPPSADSARCADEIPENMGDIREGVQQGKPRLPQPSTVHELMRHINALDPGLAMPQAQAPAGGASPRGPAINEQAQTTADGATQAALSTHVSLGRNIPSAQMPSRNVNAPGNSEPRAQASPPSLPLALRGGRGPVPADAIRGAQTALMAASPMHHASASPGLPQHGTSPAQESGNMPPPAATVAISDANVSPPAGMPASYPAAQLLSHTPSLSSPARAIAAPLDAAQWPEDFGRQVTALLRQHTTGTHTAQLQLNPPELGPLQISLNINDSIAHAVFASAHAPVRLAVENALPQLQQLLSQQGLTLAQADISHQEQGFGHRPGNPPQPGPGFRHDDTQTVSGPASQASASLPHTGYVKAGLVDIFA